MAAAVRRSAARARYDAVDPRCIHELACRTALRLTFLCVIDTSAMEVAAVLHTLGMLLLIFLPGVLGMAAGRLSKTRLVRSWVLQWQLLRGSIVFEDREIAVIDMPASRSEPRSTRKLIFKSSPGLIQSQVMTHTPLFINLPSVP
eukprot:SAG31_NODE_3086_length_4691_cov_36.726916_4_plen_145_part_00